MLNLNTKTYHHLKFRHPRLYINNALCKEHVHPLMQTLHLWTVAYHKYRMRSMLNEIPILVHVAPNLMMIFFGNISNILHQSFCKIFNRV